MLLNLMRVAREGTATTMDSIDATKILTTIMELQSAISQHVATLANSKAAGERARQEREAMRMALVAAQNVATNADRARLVSSHNERTAIMRLEQVLTALESCSCGQVDPAVINAAHNYLDLKDMP